MSNQGPINLEDVPGSTPQIDGREISNPDNSPDDRVRPIITEKEQPKEQSSEEKLLALDEKLKFIPKELHERVRKLTRADLAMPGLPKDRPAYEAFLMAEKQVRAIRKQKRKNEMNFDNIPKQD